ncbi:hypothetical protein [Aquamicrobium sp.]|uniref:hypothetical protein n=1 Tax=Aquamicrobium sp. TaxID=1872579 RepID=UPI0025867EFD|nr:hypothetical protein [Aquamicrobium sp.]MCK9549127.1 hypothetical protein [Aquamicrobium sp.]
MARTKTDPLISALIAKLPPSGEGWPVDRQIAWLKMMAQAFAVVYGGNAVAQLDAQEVAAPKAAPAPPPPKPEPKYPFVIDTQGYVRKSNAKGKRVLPGEIDNVVHDLSNGAVDLRSIIWADDSTGLNGADLTIVGA